MPLDLTTISGTLFDGSGDPAPGVPLHIVKVEKSGVVVWSRQIEAARSDDVTGQVEFTVPRDSTAWLTGHFHIGSTDFNVNEGVAVVILDVATMTLEELGAAVIPPVFLDTDGTMAADSDVRVASQKATKTYADTKQTLDADLTAIAALSPANDDVIQRKAGVWANRTITQVKTDLSLSGTNTGDQTLPVKATGAEVDTGTDDVKFVTAKALEDSDYIKEADLPAGGASYLVYTARLSQSGTDAPVATVMENTLGVTPVWSRLNAGLYKAEAATFIFGKTFVSLVGTRSNEATTQATGDDESDGQIYIIQHIASSSVMVDDGSWFVEIRVYP